MSTLSVRVPDELKRVLEARAKGQHRQPSDQVRRYLEIAMIAEDNPDLSFRMIEAILEAQAELDAGLAEPYEFGDGGGMAEFKIEAAPRFNRTAKKLPPGVKRVLDGAVRRVPSDPYRGDRKKGVLRVVYVEEFEADNARWLLAYRVQPERQTVQLLAIGRHENFYRDLSRYLTGR